MINDVTLQKSKVGEYNANYSIKQKFLQGFNAATALTHYNVNIFTWALINNTDPIVLSYLFLFLVQ